MPPLPSANEPRSRTAPPPGGPPLSAGDASAAYVPTDSQGHWREKLIGLVGSWVLRLLASTLRFQTENLDGLRKRGAGESFIFAFWHNRLLLIPVAWERFMRPPDDLGARALTSTSRDGELIAEFLGRFGIAPVRGSATRRGSTALRELARWLRRGHDVGITPDGSRGPRYEIKPGLVLLAQLSGKRIVPLSFEYSSAWRLKSWDRFFIPRPFSRVTFIVGDPFEVRRTGDTEEFEAERRRCEEIILDTTREH